MWKSKSCSGRIMLPVTIAVMLGATQPLLGAGYYFSADGHDQTGDGTQLSPWRTIGKFNSLDLDPGDSVFFRAGEVFNGSMFLDANDAGTDAFGALIAPITISSYGGGPQDRAFVRSPATAEALIAHNTGGIELRNLEFFNGGTHQSNNGSGVRFGLDQSPSGQLTHFDHIRIDNVISRGFGRSGLAINAEGGVGYQNVEVTNSQFFENRFAGVEVGAAEWMELIHRDIRIDGVTARDNPGFTGCQPHCGHGIVVGQVDGAVVRNSLAHSNGVAAGKGNVGIWTWQSNNVTIERNSAFGNRSPLGGDGGGFDIDGGVTNSVVQYNTSYDNAGAGYLLAQFGFAEPMTQNVFRYNLSVNDGVDSYGAFTIWGESSSDKAAAALIHNNTAIVDHDVAPDSLGTVWFLNGNHEEIDFINNVFVALNGATLIDGTTSADKARFVNNAYWTDGAPIRIGNEVFNSIAEWASLSEQEMLGGELVGIEANPNFDTFGEYKPAPPSPLIDAGAPLESSAWPEWFGGFGPVDLFGITIPQGEGIDIGAAEYAPVPGDYNGDGLVEAADYTIWRDSLGTIGSSLADGNDDGVVDASDYDFWKSNFSPSGGVAAGRLHARTSNVPEPGSVFIHLTVCFAWTFSSVRRRSGTCPPAPPTTGACSPTGTANRRIGRLGDAVQPGNSECMRLNIFPVPVLTRGHSV